MATKLKSKGNAAVEDPQEEETQDQPNVVYQKQRIPGPRDLMGNEVKKTKVSHNKKFHDDISAVHGENVVLVAIPNDKPVFINGALYGPGLVDCGDGTLPVDEGHGKIRDVKIADMVRAAVDKEYTHEPDDAQTVSQPMTPLGAVNVQTSPVGQENAKGSTAGVEPNTSESDTDVETEDEEVETDDTDK